MIQRLSRRAFAKAAGGAVVAASLPHPAARAAGAGSTTLRFIAQSDLRVLDPNWTTAYITRNHGYMIFDTLFALDEHFKPHPQMVGQYHITADKRSYSFTLRDGLKFHDGEPVRGVDCIASLHRWMARDALGQTMATAIDTMTAEGDKSFTIKLKTPFPLLIDALAKVSSLVPIIMPERLARTDPYKQVTEMIGSGPFKWAADEFQPGNKAVYLKNTDYVPRPEKPSWASGGKVVKVDRVEWLYVPDATTASAALGNGEVDWWEQPPLDIVPVLSANPDLHVVNSDTLGTMTILRFNQLYPPFDNIKMRQAVLAVANQADFLRSFAGDKKFWSLCPSFFTCGTPMSNSAGSEALTGPRDFAKAKKLVAEVGYKGEKIVVLDAVDQPNPHAHALVGADLLQKLGLNVDLVSTDWGNVVTRRASKKPPDQGGWHVFGTGFVGADMLDPSLNQPLRTNGGEAWFGWPSDERIEALRTQWLGAGDLAARQKIAAEIQTRAFDFVPYIPTGRYKLMTAYRNNLSGVIIAPVIFMWNVAKT